MNFDYNEDQLAFRDSLQKYLLSNYDFEKRQAIANAPDAFSQNVWGQFAELGWTYLPFAEELGGFGGSAVDTMLLFEEFGKHLIVEPFLETVMLGGKILEASDFSGKTELVESVMSGATQLALAHFEGAHYGSLDQVSTIAEAQGSGFKLSGKKTFVGNAVDANHFIISAKVDNKIGLFLMPSSVAGMTLTNYKTAHAKTAAELELKAVELGQDALLVSGDEALALLRKVVDEATIAIVAEMVGAMEVLIEATVEYSKDREQFGQPIGKFQVLQHMMADMFIAKELARSLMYAAAIKLRDGDDDASKYVSAAKAKVGVSATQVAHYAVQIHGGIATTDELKIGHYLKRILVNNKLLGSVDYHLRRYKNLAKSSSTVK